MSRCICNVCKANRPSGTECIFVCVWCCLSLFVPFVLCQTQCYIMFTRTHISKLYAKICMFNVHMCMQYIILYMNIILVYRWYFPVAIRFESVVLVQSAIGHGICGYAHTPPRLGQGRRWRWLCGNWRFTSAMICSGHCVFPYMWPPMLPALVGSLSRFFF